MEKNSQLELELPFAVTDLKPLLEGLIGRVNLRTVVLRARRWLLLSRVTNIT